MPSSACYICDISPRNTKAEGLSFHWISKKITKRPIVEKWLKFLLLPTTNLWPDQRWTQIRLCSIHFNEEDYFGRQMCLRKVLRDDAVPTKNPPNGPGLFGALFHQGEANTENSPEMEELQMELDPETPATEGASNAEETFGSDFQVKEEVEDDVLTDFEGIWNYHKLKEEGRELESAEGEKIEEKLKEEERWSESPKEVNLEEDDEEEVKPAQLILVQPNVGDNNNVKCEERNIFDEEEVKPALLILVQPNVGDNKNVKCEERNIFDEDDGLPKMGDLGVEKEKEL